jgi:ribose 5-phosphate isomerase B
MRIAVASDHAGYRLKETVREFLISQDHEVIDFGTNNETAVDYPDFIIPAAQAVSLGPAEAGIVFGGSGNGEAIAANKVRGIRCAVCWNSESAELAKKHNNANVIAIGARMVSKDQAIEIIKKWMNTKFEGGRHIQRIEKIHTYEEGEKQGKET